MLVVTRHVLDVLQLDAFASVRTRVEETVAIVDAHGDARVIPLVSLRQLVPVAGHELMNDLLPIENEELVFRPITDLLAQSRTDAVIAPILALARRGCQEPADLDGPLFHAQGL